MNRDGLRTALTVILVGVTVVAVLVGGWYGYWALKNAATRNNYEVNNHSQQYQLGLIAQERDRVTAYNAATDPTQKTYIKAQFCQIYPDLDPAPTDLVTAYQTIC